MRINRVSLNDQGVFALLVLLGLFFSYSIQSDELQTSWGRIIDPKGECLISDKGNKDGDSRLIISIPGTIHDLDPRKGQPLAPRVLKAVKGDFTYTVKITADYERVRTTARKGANAFVSAGILVWDDENNFLRLEKNLWTTPNKTQFYYAPLFEHYKDNKLLKDGGPGISFISILKKINYLRLRRKGNLFIADVSEDGNTWILTKSHTALFPETVQLGVSAVNTSDSKWTVSFTQGLPEMP